MSLREEDKGIAFSCDRDGTILRIIRDELELPQLLRTGNSIINLVEGSYTDRAQKFISTLNERLAVFDWELAMRVDGQPTPMHFAGAELDGTLLIVAARSCSGLARFSEDLMLINNEQTNALRTAIKELSLQNRQQSQKDIHLYEDLSRVNNELANLQRELSRKNAELEKLNEQKNRFLGIAAHDLRSPLGVIFSYAEFLETEAASVLNEEQREFVATIKDTSAFMLRMVTDLLDVTAIEAGQLKLDLQLQDLAQVIRRNVTLNRVLATKKDIIVEFDPPIVPKQFAFDASKLEQVLNNLIGNAIKFSHRGTTVHVQLIYKEDLATVTVKDQGQGIPTLDLPKLFKPFSKTSVRSTAGEPSTGLGLAIVRKIIECHGGHIWVESVVGQGSLFFFTLPTNLKKIAAA